MTHNQPPRPPVGPAAYCAACAASGCGACDDLPYCPRGGLTRPEPRPVQTVYLAAHYARNAEMRTVRDILHGLGYKVTSRWIDQHGGSLTEALGEAELNEQPELGVPYALKDLEDIKAADIVISFTNGQGRGGRHVEFGMAVILGKQLVIVGPREHVFHTLPGIELYPDAASLYAEWINRI